MIEATLTSLALTEATLAAHWLSCCDFCVEADATCDFNVESEATCDFKVDVEAEASCDFNVESEAFCDSNVDVDADASCDLSVDNDFSTDSENSLALASATETDAAALVNEALRADKLAVLNDSSLAKLKTELEACCSLVTDNEVSESDATDSANETPLKLVKTDAYWDCAVPKLCLSPSRLSNASDCA